MYINADTQLPVVTSQKMVETHKQCFAAIRTVKIANSQKLVSREPLTDAWTDWEAPNSFVPTYLCIANHPN